MIKSTIRLGVFGGTFDPIHFGHLKAAETAKSALSLDHVLFIPSGDPWRKQTPPNAAGADRLAMVQAAIADTDGFSASAIEIERPGPTYSIDTIRTLQNQGYEKMWGVVGRDVLNDISNWYMPEDLIRSARLAVVSRHSEIEIGKGSGFSEWVAGVIDWVEMPEVEISSSEIRKHVSMRNTMALGMEVPAPVLEYIQSHDLYET